MAPIQVISCLYEGRSLLLRQLHSETLRSQILHFETSTYLVEEAVEMHLSVRFIPSWISRWWQNYTSVTSSSTQLYVHAVKNRQTSEFQRSPRTYLTICEVPTQHK